MIENRVSAGWTVSAEACRQRILPLRQRAEVRNAWLKQRLDEVLPHVMRREGFDMWIVAAREYNEDPVIMTMLPEPSMAARRRTILVFARKSDGSVERISIDRYGFRDFYTQAWNPDEQDQFACLAQIVRERDPAVIGINFSQEFAFGDGLTHSEHGQIAAALGDDLMKRVKSAERLCIGWLERRIPPEMAVYPGIIEIGHVIIAEAFSNRVIHPGITTTDDLVWWLRQTMLDLGLQAWFQPSVEIQAQDQPALALNANKEAYKRSVIMPGDLLHCDVGFYYLGLATDHQQHAYVLKPGETDAPQGLKAALADGNRLQDILMGEMAAGRTGNQVLKAALDRAKAEGLTPSIYSHAIGFHGHAAGPTIGLWDRQDGVPERGDYELFDHTCYSIELNIMKAVPEWDGQQVRIALEEDAALSGGAMHWLAGRQTAFHLIG